MPKNLKIYFLGLAGIALGGLAFVRIPAARADSCLLNTTLNFVASDPGGAFIANARVTVYEQVTDVNGNPKPGSQLASGSTDAILGTAKLVWRNTLASDTYAVKVQTVNNDNASFWYYGQTLACGQTATLSETLSGILFSLHSSNGNPLLNSGFNVYSEVYDASGNAQKQLNQLLVSANSGAAGQTTVYLPQGSVRSMTKTVSDNYALNIPHNGQNFNFYNIAVHDGQLTTMSYFIPSLNVRLHDANGSLFPSGTSVAVFQQTVDSRNLEQAGTQVGSFTLGADGSGTFDVPTGLYVLGIKGQNNTYQYFWDMQVVDGQANTYDLTATSTPATNNLTTACPNNANFSLTLEDMSGDLLPGLKFALYEQNTDANGLPIVGNQVGSGTVSNSGQASVSLRPDPRKIYALKVWDRSSTLGVFWFYSAVRFVCGYDRALTENLPALHVILRDSQGQLKRNAPFSIYAQEYDADHHPFFQSSDLIASVQTDGGGQALVYVAPYNPYMPSQSGSYVISVRDANGNTSSFYNVKIPVDQDYTFEAALSGISGGLNDAQSHALPNKELDLYEENTSGQYLSLGARLLTLRTDSNGKFQFEYPAGTYALVSPDDFNRSNVFWNIAIKSGSNYQPLTTNDVVFSLLDPQGQGLGNNPSLTLYSLSRASNGAYYQDSQVGTISPLGTGKTVTKSLAVGTYLAVYNGLGNQQYGQAFYIKNGSVYNAKVSLSASNRITANQAFWLPAAAAAITPLSATSGASGSSSPSSSSSSSSSGASSSNNAPAGSLAAQLKGRILLQVQDKGQAWYVNPTNGKKYSLGRPSDAFNLMRRFGLGVSNANFASIQNNPSAWRQLAGRILLKVEDKGQAYYFDPVDFQLYYLGRPADAFNIMRTRGLGITNGNLGSINTGN